MLRQAARSSRLLRLCQAATALRLAPCVAAESGAAPDLPSRAFGAVTQPFAMCDVSKAPPQHHAPPASKPANPPRSAHGQDMKKRAFTSIEDDSGVFYPEATARINHPAPDFTIEGTLCLPRWEHYTLVMLPVFTLSVQVALPCSPYLSHSNTARTHQLNDLCLQSMMLQCCMLAELIFMSCSCVGWRYHDRVFGRLQGQVSVLNCSSVSCVCSSVM